jgi:rhomboid family GlyGly-CTERM serine protease
VNMRTPICTVAVLLGGVIAYLCPSVASLFIYDRTAVMHGEVWRLATSHLVHFDGWHLAYDLIAFGIAGALVESRGRRHLCAVFLITAVSICTFFLVARPEMTAYGGLSGVACAALTYLALLGLDDAWPWRTVYRLALVVVAVKLCVECTTGASLLPYPSPGMCVPVWEAHAIGCGVGALYFSAQRFLAFVGGRTLSGNPFCLKSRARTVCAGSRILEAVSGSASTCELRRVKDMAAGAVQ